jgi:hypothetical protein
MKGEVDFARERKQELAQTAGVKSKCQRSTRIRPDHRTKRDCRGILIDGTVFTCCAALPCDTIFSNVFGKVKTSQAVAGKIPALIATSVESLKTLIEPGRCSKMRQRIVQSNFDWKNDMRNS